MAPSNTTPYRFLPGQRRQTSPVKDSTRPLAPFREAAPAGSEDLLQEYPDHPSHLNQTQFATTPRFSFGRTRTQRTPPSPPRPAFAQDLHAIAQVREDVEDGSEGDEAMLDDPRDALPTTEDDLDALNAYPNIDDEFSPNPSKRRRLEAVAQGDTTTSSPPRLTFKHPQTPASQLNKAVPRFGPPQSSATSATDGMGHNRPAFLPSSIALPGSSEPLPEAFSPHRRGQKFMPGGMAATVQQWVVDTGQAVLQSRRGQASTRDEDHVTQIKVDQVMGEGPYTVKTRSATGAEVNVLLTRHGGGGTAGAVAIAEGSVVGIRAPSWDVDADGRTWTVGVDWQLLS